MAFVNRVIMNADYPVRVRAGEDPVGRSWRGVSQFQGHGSSPASWPDSRFERRARKTLISQSRLRFLQAPALVLTDLRFGPFAEASGGGTHRALGRPGQVIRATQSRMGIRCKHEGSGLQKWVDDVLPA